MGFNNPTRRVNNWNPWIFSNWLASALLIEQDETLRVRSIFKAIQALDNFIDQYPQEDVMKVQVIGDEQGPHSMIASNSFTVPLIVRLVFMTIH